MIGDTLLKNRWQCLSRVATFCVYLLTFRSNIASHYKSLSRNQLNLCCFVLLFVFCSPLTKRNMALVLATGAIQLVFQLTALLSMVVSIIFGHWIFAGVVVLLATLAFTGSFFVTNTEQTDDANFHHNLKQEEFLSNDDDDDDNHDTDLFENQADLIHLQQTVGDAARSMSTKVPALTLEQEFKMYNAGNQLPPVVLSAEQVNLEQQRLARRVTHSQKGKRMEALYLAPFASKPSTS